MFARLDPPATGFRMISNCRSEPAARLRYCAALCESPPKYLLRLTVGAVPLLFVVVNTILLQYIISALAALPH